MTIRAAARTDLPAIRDLLVRANQTPYDIGAVAEEKVFGAGYRGDPEVRVFEEQATILGVAVSCGRALRIIAVDPAHRRRGIGRSLLPPSTRVIFAEAGNYFTPGIIENDEATRRFFARSGFVESRWTFNLETAELPDSPPPDVARATLSQRREVLAFIENEFGAIWRFEAARAFTSDPITLFIVKTAGAIAGFAAHEVNNHGLGFFGPTGVASSQRNLGYGSRLLAASLADLRRLGHRRITIPWTDALDFYRKSCGAVVTARFVTMSRA